jgi:hypothetical protein
MNVLELKGGILNRVSQLRDETSLAELLDMLVVSCLPRSRSSNLIIGIVYLKVRGSVC